MKKELLAILEQTYNEGYADALQEAGKTIQNYGATLKDKMPEDYVKAWSDVGEIIKTVAVKFLDKTKSE